MCILRRIIIIGTAPIGMALIGKKWLRFDVYYFIRMPKLNIASVKESSGEQGTRKFGGIVRIRLKSDFKKIGNNKVKSGRKK